MAILGTNGVLSFRLPSYTEFLWLAEIREWSLTVGGSAIDTTPLGVDFTTAQKDLISCSGNLSYQLDVSKEGQTIDPFKLLELCANLQGNAEAEARFYLVSGTDMRLFAFDRTVTEVYYQVNIVLTESTVRVSPRNIIAGAADFVGTGQINYVVL